MSEMNSLTQQKGFLSRTFGKVKFNRTAKKGSSKEFIAKLSRGLMLPIAMLPIAGLFLGIGAAIATAGLNNNDEALKIFGNFLKIPGDVIFQALPILFAVAIAIAFTKDAGPAGLAAVIGWLVFAGLQSAMIQPQLGADGQLLGYNLLFYTGAASLSGSSIFGLESSLFSTTFGILQLSTSIVGGFIVGFLVSWLYNKYKNIQLPSVIGFFSGVRFIPIITFLSLFPVTLVTMMIWPLIGTAFYWLGFGLGSGYLYGFNSFIFGYIERSLVPLGLHHAFYSPLWYTAAGGTLDLSSLAVIQQGGISYGLTLNGSQVVSWGAIAAANGYTGSITGAITGDQNLWAFTNSYFAGVSINMIQVQNIISSNNVITGVTNVTGASALPYVVQFSDFTSSTNFVNGTVGVNVGQYLQGKYVFMMFGLPAAAVAMVMAAPKENRKVASSIVISAGFTSLLTGITEPIEFTFLFLAPWLFWGFHAFFCAVAFGLMNWIGLIMAATGAPEFAPHIGMTFSGGLIDWVVYGGIQIPGGSNAWWSLIFGLFYVPIYYFFFYWAIKHFDIGTPGRGGNTKLFTKKDFLEKNSGDSTGSLNLNLNNDLLFATQVIKAYGGVSNIKNIDACITKLRVEVADQAKVNSSSLTSDLGAMGVIKPSPQSVYSIYGAKADFIKNNMKEVLDMIKQDPSLEEKLFSAEIASSVEKDVSSNTLLSDEKLIIRSPMSGKIVNIENIPDETFSQEIVGVGIGIEPSTKDLVAPFNGKLSLVYKTNHAYTFESKKGTQVLIHVGIDSINLKDNKGKVVSPFHSNVKTGDACKTGSVFAKVDLEILKKYAKSNISPIVILNESIFGREIKILKKSGIVKKGDPIIEIAPSKLISKK